MSKRSWLVLVGIVVWVVSASYFGAAYGASSDPANKARELIEQDRREALQQLLAQNPELESLIKQISEQVK